MKTTKMVGLGLIAFLAYAPSAIAKPVQQQKTSEKSSYTKAAFYSACAVVTTSVMYGLISGARKYIPTRTFERIPFEDKAYYLYLLIAETTILSYVALRSSQLAIKNLSGGQAKKEIA